MADNEAKNKKIAELEDRIVALEGGGPPQPVDKKNKITTRLNYICTRIKKGQNISEECYNDLEKFTTADDDEDQDTIMARRKKIIRAFGGDEDDNFDEILAEIKQKK